jgi:predicted glycosyl hydrolase (DUF1957 family)
VLKKVCDEAYRPLIDVFEENPQAKATVNICAVLTELLWECGHDDVIKGLRRLGERGQLEFTGSGKYHPILPLIPREEIERQIRRNHLSNRYYLGEAYIPRGFFPPELCYSKETLEPIIASRHEWILLSGTACPASWPMDIICEAGSEEERIAVFFRDDILSNRISFQSVDGQGFLEHLRQLQKGESDIYVITAMDAETFGHHIQNWEKLFLAKVYESLLPSESPYKTIKQRQRLAVQHRALFEFQKETPVGGIRVVTISQLLELFPRRMKVEPIPSSWSTTADDIKGHNFYPLWKDRGNPIHHLQWEHLDICLDIVKTALEVGDNPTSRKHGQIARGLLDEALHSCQFWWASKRQMWDINMVYLGLQQQQAVILNALKSIRSSGASQELKHKYYYQGIIARDIAYRISEGLVTG